MSPIDDALRAALQVRARAVAPGPDPLSGIERRARRIRRNRAAASVVGSALAVATVATAVPLLQPTTPRSEAAPVASTASTLSPAPAPVTDPYALDPADPWEFRGDASLLDGFPETAARELAAERGVDESAVQLTPLFAQVYEPSGRAELVFLAEAAGDLSWGVAQASEAGPELIVDEPLPSPAYALAAGLAGDGVARLLVVSAPGTTTEYGPSDSSEFARTEPVEDGVHVLPLEGDPATDFYRVLDEAGEEVVRVPAPDGPGFEDGEQGAEPVNLLDWPQRGSDMDPELQGRVEDLFEQGLGGDGATYRPLFSGDTDGGVRFTVGQAWLTGGEAHTVSLAVGGEQGEQFLLGPATDPDTRVVAQLVCCQTGTTTDTLVVVPIPGTGQVLYDEDDAGDFRPVGEGQDYLDGVVLVDREVMADRDRLQLLDGNGDFDRPLFQGPVSDLLCGIRECG